ncbi:MAG TPA: RNase adapter RapZ [Mycobacteriales bacterium]|nr:RNase adapter RapZ [Mycobacteriales bacterium]
MSVDLVVVTGMSGAGRSTAAKCLEDLGWFVVDNLPPSLLATMVDLGERSHGQVERIAVVADVRSRAFSSDLEAALGELDDRDARVRVIFLEASDDALVRRFESNRRPHPLQGDGRIVDGIEEERVLLRELRGEADLVLDTSVLNVHELRTKVAAAFGAEGQAARVSMTLMSFGYKYGLPVDADLVIDCRFLPNPHWVEELRPRTGQDPEVRAYVLGQPAAGEFLERFEGLVRLLLEGYEREHKQYVTLAVGCTGGKHRSVAISEALARRLEGPGLEVQVQHRDLGRE